MKISKQKVKRLIAFVLFLFLAWEVFLHCTYLFRNAETEGRLTILGFYREKEDSLDVVTVGSSAVNRYWDCMTAWNDYGMASYNYSTPAMNIGTTIAALKDIEKRQKPEVIVIEVRKVIERYLDMEEKVSTQNILDSQDFNLDRLAAVDYMRRLRGLSVKDTLSEYIELMEYHNNHTVFVNEKNWEFWDNRADESVDKYGFYKGFMVVDKHEVLEKPDNVWTEQTTELNAVAEKAYTDILEYCSSKGLNVLLAVAPYQVTENDEMQINRMMELAEEYEIPFIDANRYYDEMNIDFSSDFYNQDHVNILGAEKYTDFMARYLKEHYDLPDRREDLGYAKWQEDYEEYAQGLNNGISNAEGKVDTMNTLRKKETKMREMSDGYAWIEATDDPELTVFIVKNQKFSKDFLPQAKLALGHLQITDKALQKKTYLGVYQGGESIYSSITDKENLGRIDEAWVEYLISVGENSQIQIGDLKYDVPAQEGIAVLVLDNITGKAADFVLFDASETGELKMEHLEMKGKS